MRRALRLAAVALPVAALDIIVAPLLLRLAGALIANRYLLLAVYELGLAAPALVASRFWPRAERERVELLVLLAATWVLEAGLLWLFGQPPLWWSDVAALLARLTVLVAAVGLRLRRQLRS